MMVVLTVVTAVCGGGLAMVKMATAQAIEDAIIKNIKGPALEKIFSEYDNDPAKDRKKIVTGKDKKGKDIETTVFYARKDGKLIAVAIEAYGGGFAGQVGVMMSINQPNEVLGGIALTTHSETPSKVEPVAGAKFCDQFKGKSIDANFGLSSAGGEVNAISGSSMSSGGASKAVQNGMEIYKSFKPEILG